jgi:hypothetical protein
MALNAICRHNQDLWIAVLPLICYYIVEWHLPICVMHQFGGLQIVVVQHEATSENLHKFPTLLTYVSMFHYKLVRF